MVKHDGKPGSFVGSKKWIGSTEVGIYLDTCLGVQYKILFLPNGAELPSHARALAAHFESEGTPIMMGAGQYAYTLLGVDWNESTGDVRFLVLDPHYVGRDTMDEVQKRSKVAGVAWRDSLFFDQTSFYNLCLPLKPTAI